MQSDHSSSMLPGAIWRGDSSRSTSRVIKQDAAAPGQSPTPLPCTLCPASSLVPGCHPATYFPACLWHQHLQTLLPANLCWLSRLQSHSLWHLQTWRPAEPQPCTYLSRPGPAARWRPLPNLLPPYPSNITRQGCQRETQCQVADQGKCSTLQHGNGRSCNVGPRRHPPVCHHALRLGGMALRRHKALVAVAQLQDAPVHLGVICDPHPLHAVPHMLPMGADDLQAAREALESASHRPHACALLQQPCLPVSCTGARSSLHALCAVPRVLPAGTCDLQGTSALLTAGPLLPVVCDMPGQWSHSLL